MVTRNIFFPLAALVCLVPEILFATGSDDEGTPPKPVACASSHPQCETQLENTNPTQNPKLASTLEVEAHNTTQLLHLPNELLDRILFFACKNVLGPEPVQKGWSRLRLVCKAFYHTVMHCPEFWTHTHVFFKNLEHTNNFLTQCAFKDRLDVTVDVSQTNLLAKENQATWEALKAAIQRDTEKFTLDITNPSEAQMDSLAKLFCPLKVMLSNSVHEALPLERWKTLHTLHVEKAAFETFDCSGLTHLKNLILDECNHFITLVVQQPINLTSLELRRMKIVESLPLDQLGSLTNLLVESLELRNLPVNQLIHLTDLTVRSSHHLEGLPLNQLAHLTKLTVECNDKIPEVLLNNARNLTHLILGHLQLNPLPSAILGNLTHLLITHCDGLETFPFNQLYNLKFLCFENCDNLPNPFVIQLHNLIALGFYTCGAVQTLDVKWLSNLQALFIKDCQHIATLSSRHHPYLRSVKIDACPALPQEQIEALQALVQENGGPIDIV
ncbi:MAG: hypothetical protein V6Z78_00845 [Holosporaceae bacterium]